MEASERRFRRMAARQAERTVETSSLGESISDLLGRGSRGRPPEIPVPGDSGHGPDRDYRLRTPTRSEGLNRSLVELSSAAFKIHLLIWEWRGAPARGLLPFFTIHSLSKFCSMSRPTVRSALKELTGKGWIVRLPYNKHHKNALYRLVPVRKVPAPAEKPPGKSRSVANS